MRILFAALAVSASAFVPAYAQAQTQASAAATPPARFYGQINLGASVMGNADAEVSVDTVGSLSDDIDLDAGLFGGLLAGMDAGNGLHAQIEGLFFETNGDTQDYEEFAGGVFDASVRTYGVLLNGLYEAPTSYGFSPYAGAGVGYGSVEYDVEGLEDDGENGLMWQIKAGATFPVGDRFTWDLGYRYLRAPEYEISETIPIEGEMLDADLSVETGAHILAVGGRIAF